MSKCTFCDGELVERTTTITQCTKCDRRYLFPCGCPVLEKDDIALLKAKRLVMDALGHYLRDVIELGMKNRET